MESAQPFARRGQLLEQVRDLGGQLRQAPDPRLIFWKFKVGPKVTEDFRKVRFAGAVEAADPGCLLLGPVQIANEHAQGLLQTLGVFALADEGLQLEPQRLQLLRRDHVFDERDPVVQQLKLNNGVAFVKDVVTPEELKTLRFELKTFVCEGEYSKGLEKTLRMFIGNLDRPEQQAAWVSGFYGSGKSHLTKILRYLWTDFEFPEDKARARGLD